MEPGPRSIQSGYRYVHAPCDTLAAAAAAYLHRAWGPGGIKPFSRIDGAGSKQDGSVIRPWTKGEPSPKDAESLRCIPAP